MHVLSTYNGVQLSEREEFPKDWLRDGMKTLSSPFRFKPGRRSKIKSHHRVKDKKQIEGFLQFWEWKRNSFLVLPKDSFFEPTKEKTRWQL